MNARLAELAAQLDPCELFCLILALPESHVLYVAIRTGVEAAEERHAERRRQIRTAADIAAYLVEETAARQADHRANRDVRGAADWRYLVSGVRSEANPDPDRQEGLYGYLGHVSHAQMQRRRGVPDGGPA